MADPRQLAFTNRNLAEFRQSDVSLVVAPGSDERDLGVTVVTPALREIMEANRQQALARREAHVTRSARPTNVVAPAAASLLAGSCAF